MRDRWHVVTIYRSPDEALPEGRLPRPLAELGHKIEVRTRPAPAGRGTELAARLREPIPEGLKGTVARLTGRDPRHPLRKALRTTKSLIETGEVLRKDEPPTTRRTLTSLPLELAIRRSWEEGRL